MCCVQSKRAVQTDREASVETELGGQTEGKKVCRCVYREEGIAEIYREMWCVSVCIFIRWEWYSHNKKCSLSVCV